MAAQGRVTVRKDGKEITVLHPEKRNYNASGMPMTEASIQPGLLRDLYVSLGEPIPGTNAWAVRVYIKPCVDWIWFGCLMMVIGGVVAITDRRYRIHARKAQAVVTGGASLKEKTA
jgi:cytochrome c-type biogenesis protein CcmF